MSSDGSAADRRLAPRYPAHLMVSVTVEGGPAQQLLCTSISQTGMFIQIAAPPGKGAAIGVHLVLPYGAVTLRGVVRRSVMQQGQGEAEAPGFGIEIAEVTEGAEAWAGLVRTARMRAPTKVD
jgi:hypothetical protein